MQKSTNSKSNRVYYCNMPVNHPDAPFSILYLAATDSGLCNVSLSKKAWDSFVKNIKKNPQIILIANQKRLKKAIDEFNEYFTHKLRTFTVAIDLFGVTNFEARVLKTAYKVPWGETTSYGALGEVAGIPSSGRAVGNAMRKNPLPIIIPCHRILKSDGSIGGYTGGLDKKFFLLNIEGIDI